MGSERLHQLLMHAMEHPLLVFVVFLPCVQVLFKQVNDGFSVFELFFTQVVDLFQCGSEGLVCNMTSLGVIINDLVIENAQVQTDGELDRATRL